jgi:hypothetical protein
MVRTAINTGWAMACTVALAFSIGCDSTPTVPTVRLQGKVTIGGQPIPDNADARITFRPTTAGQANGMEASIKNGMYDVPSAPKGKVQVTFFIQQPTGRVESFDGVARPEPVMKDLVPQGKGMTEVTVEGDKSDLNFDL